MIRASLLLIIFMALISGCSSEALLKKSNPATETNTPSPSKVIKSRAIRLNTYTPSNNCSHITRDLSMPNATTIWCIPKGIK